MMVTTAVVALGAAGVHQGRMAALMAPKSVEPIPGPQPQPRGGRKDDLGRLEAHRRGLSGRRTAQGGEGRPRSAPRHLQRRCRQRRSRVGRLASRSAASIARQGGPDGRVDSYTRFFLRPLLRACPCLSRSTLSRIPHHLPLLLRHRLLQHRRLLRRRRQAHPPHRHRRQPRPRASRSAGAAFTPAGSG
jgi:hypothetical protein